MKKTVWGYNRHLQLFGLNGQRDEFGWAIERLFGIQKTKWSNFGLFKTKRSISLLLLIRFTVDLYKRMGILGTWQILLINRDIQAVRTK